MEHFSTILKIVEGGLQIKTQTVVNYARELQRQLESQGQSQQARLLQTKLDGAESLLTAYGVQTQQRLPADQESRLDLATLETCSPLSSHAVLDPVHRHEVDRFLERIRAADKLEAAGVPVAARMILSGPPGVGKTQLARHIAAELDLPLLTARGDSLISSALGSTAKNIRRLFDHAKETPCVLFLDEFDALAKARDDAHELGELKRVVVSLLQNIDALPSRSVVLAATNHPQLLDPAVWRRFSYHLHLDLPHPELRHALFASYLGNRAPSHDLQAAVTVSEGLSGAIIRQIAEEAVRTAVLNDEGEVSPALLLRLTAQASLKGRRLTPSTEAVAELLLAYNIPVRTVVESANLSKRQVGYLSAALKAAAIRSEGEKHGGRQTTAQKAPRGASGGARRSQKPDGGGSASGKRAASKTRRR